MSREQFHFIVDAKCSGVANEAVSSMDDAGDARIVDSDAGIIEPLSGLAIIVTAGYAVAYIISLADVIRRNNAPFVIIDARGENVTVTEHADSERLRGHLLVLGEGGEVWLNEPEGLPRPLQGEALGESLGFKQAEDV